MAEQGIDLSRYLRHGAKITETGSDDWQTPRVIYEALNKRFQFTRDAAATKQNSHCARYWTKEDDALLMDWTQEKSLFINPPYSKVESFLAKAHEPGTAVFLIPFRPQTGFFLRYVWASQHLHEMMIIHRGIRFIHPDRVESVRSPMPCCILVYRREERERDLLITVNCADSLHTLHVVAGQRPGHPLEHGHSIRNNIIQEYQRGTTVAELVKKYEGKVSRRSIYRWVK
ncbi:TPA: adenine methyltransferase [Klebsiella pneumoniae]|uniref:DNA N-6-adenine-methyltransferase n=1 Tax=Enterobacteriaceae TaxID=543 RepID=UPI001BCC8428|nr:DNA N-6-adenine-methyltransferase [Klebsiella pneumoniae]HDS7788803.1 adenine methyltransferase [Klebsiella pneumoniae subsp. ozaenae]HDU3805801.1 adenine methyltransferase [Klebsiella pneumoniae subsp. pneumoniae]EIW1122482.1 adenine methyltransferase [Klebsiella pneumoniae]MBS4507283.1 adenine methyltransferase [Klebsiella pneumoniae]MBS4520921.1 adenine methyltransferase [Klebsiella pneumoniae]